MFNLAQLGRLLGTGAGVGTLKGDQRVSPLLDQAEQHVGKLGGLDAQVGKRLGGGVDLLVDQVTLDLVGVGGLPVQELLSPRHQLEQLKRGVVVGVGVRQQQDVTVVVSDVVDHFPNFGIRVLSTVQFVGLAGGGVVVDHLLKRFGNVQGVYGSHLLGVAVGQPHLRLGAQVVEQVVFSAEDGGGTDDGDVGAVGFSHRLFTDTLGGVKHRIQVGVGVVRREVDEPGDAGFLGEAGDSFGDANVDVGHGEVLGVVVSTNAVDDDVGVGDGVLDRLDVARVKFDKVDDAKVPQHLEETLLHVVTVRDDGGGTVLGQFGGGVTTNTPSRPEHGDGVPGPRRAQPRTHGLEDLAVLGDVQVGCQRQQRRVIAAQRLGNRTQHGYFDVPGHGFFLPPFGWPECAWLCAGREPHHAT